ncbi:cellulose binding domain-containing protein [Amycolatopsis sp. NPDC021455]|uniref:cellulose binding domain-containing protein n=1 Tax=Amycolatopsis sp. NPDC021455 TaxID=3154901 RepID=UPI0033D09C0C
MTGEWSGGQRIGQAWNATVGQGGTARNAEWNGAPAPGASATFGFLATGTGGRLHGGLMSRGVSWVTDRRSQPRPPARASGKERSFYLHLGNSWEKDWPPCSRRFCWLSRWRPPRPAPPAGSTGNCGRGSRRRRPTPTAGPGRPASCCGTGGPARSTAARPRAR